MCLRWNRLRVRVLAVSDKYCIDSCLRVYNYCGPFGVLCVLGLDSKIFIDIFFRFTFIAKIIVFCSNFH